MKKTSIYTLYLIALVISILGCDPEPYPDLPRPWNRQGTRIDEKIYDFQLQDTSGNLVKPSDFQGNVLLVSFFAAWSDEVRDQARWLGCSDLDRTFGCYIENHREQGFKSIIILIDNEDGKIPTLEEAQSWKERYGITDPVLIDTSEREIFNIFTDNDLSDGLQENDSYFIPLSIVVDQDFIIFNRFTEFLQEDMESDLKRLLLPSPS